ncbi:hypothetical protein ACVIW2_007101 [Bradyrhizobium huanghuaihaiense]
MVIRTEQPRLSSIALVRRFPAEDVRRTQFLFEDEFKSLIGGETTAINAPLAPPEAPRFMMTDGKRTLVVSNVSAQLSLDFGGSLPPKLTLADALDRAARTMDSSMERIFAKQSRWYSGIVIVWTATQMNLNSLSEELVEWTMKTHFAPQLSHYGATIGVERKGFNRTIEISLYKSFQRIATSGQTHIHVDADFEPPEDQGLQIKIDVNTRPQISSPPKNAFQNLIPVILETIRVDLQSLVGSQLASSLPQ